MSKESLVALLFVGVLFVFFFWRRVIQLFRWLKGSRKTYYFSCFGRPKDTSWQSRTIYSSDLSYTLLRQIYIIGTAIEIYTSPLRQRSVIRSSYAKGELFPWTTMRARKEDGKCSVNLVLKDLQGRPVEEALRLINTYQSLQAMLDRIAELENNHKLAEAKFQMVFAAIVALRFQILSDKQRYRSPAAKEIREDLDMVIEEINSLLTDHDSLRVWEKRFQDHRDWLRNLSQ